MTQRLPQKPPCPHSVGCVGHRTVRYQLVCNSGRCGHRPLRFAIESKRQINPGQRSQRFTFLSRSVKYCSTFLRSAFAVSTGEYIIAEASAPAGVQGQAYSYTPVNRMTGFTRTSVILIRSASVSTGVSTAIRLCPITVPV